MRNVMLRMRDSHVGVGIQDMKMKMIHVIIHVNEKQQHTNNHWNLQNITLH